MRKRTACALLVMASAWATRAEDRVTLTSGETLRGEIIWVDEARIIFSHPILGRLEISRDHVATMIDDDAAGADETHRAAEQSTVTSNPRGANDAFACPPVVRPASNDVASSDQDRAGTAPDPDRGDAVLPTAISPWKARLELGFTGAFAASDQLDLRFAAQISRETPAERTRFDALYLFGSTDGDARQNRLSTGLTQDWLVPSSRWFYFTQGRVEIAQFQAWDTRLNLAGGAGYNLYETDRLNLKVRAGLNAKQEFGNTVVDDGVQPEGLLGTELAWRLNGAHRLATANTLYRELAEADMYRLVSSAEWVIDIDRANGVNLKLGLENEYESRAAEGQSHNDLRIFGALVVSF